MTKAHFNQTSFNSGIISEKMQGNVTIQKYNAALADCENFICLKQGPAEKRPGTVYVNEVKTSANDTILVPFEHDGTTYHLEFGNLYIRFHSAGATLGAPYEVVTTYTTAQLREMDFASYLDTLYIVHKEHAPAALTITSPTSWTLSDLVFLDGPYLEKEKASDDANNSRFTISTHTPVGAAVTLTAINGHTPFVSDDASGRYFRTSANPDGLDWGAIKITGFTSTTVVTGEIIKVAQASDQQSWRFGAYSDGAGYPATVEVHQRRLFFGGGDTAQDGDTAVRLFSSRTNKLDDFTPTQDDTDEPLATDGLSYEFAEAVNWLISSQRLYVGTDDSEYSMSTANDGALTPDDLTSTKISTYGADDTRKPILAANTALFIQRGGRRLRAISYDLTQDRSISNDITVFSDDITKSKIKKMVYQKEPNSVVWMVMDDGTCAALTYDPIESVVAWSKVVFGGTDVLVTDISTSPSQTDARDEVYFIIERTIDGSTVKYIEYLDKEFDLQDDQEDAHFVDAGIIYDSTATTSITGLTHLEGETVKVFADGAVRPDATVSSGAITLATEASNVHVGLGYTAKLQTLPPEIALADGSSQGRRQRTHKVGVRVSRSKGFKVGQSLTDLETVSLRSSSDPMNQPVPLFSGFKEISPRNKWTTESQILVVSDTPVPLMVTGIVRRISINEP